MRKPITRRLRAASGVTVLVVMATALLGGCGGSSPSGSPSSSGAPAVAPSGAASTGSSQGTSAPDPALVKFYSQHLSWSSCRSGDDECSWLTVPLDYDHPDGATIKLALLKVPAADKDERIGSLVVNPGGPGGSGVDYAAEAKEAFRSPLLDHYDIVGFDPRGVGKSDPVDCISDAQLDQYIAQDQSPDTPAEVKQYAAANRALADGCAKSPIGAHISTVDAARDVDVLRAALGESQLDYFGASYGTKLGTTYADLFPKRVGRFVLDGAIDPTLRNKQLSIQQAAGFQTALRSYVQNCVDGGNCFLGSTVDAGLARIKSFLDQVKAHPLPASGGRQLEPGNAFYGVAVTLYNRDYWTYLTQALQAAFKGDGSTLLALSDVYTDRDPNGNGYSDNSMEALYDIDCLDDPTSIKPSQVPSVLPAFEKASPTFGDVFAWGLTSCSDFKEKADATAPPIGAPGANPIVVIGTTRDPATPVQWAQHLAKLLKSGVLVTRDGDGHTGYNTGNTCVNNAVEDYLVKGTVPKNGLSC